MTARNTGFRPVCWCWPAARAQAWPTRPIKAVQGFAAGGNADTIARVLPYYEAEIAPQLKAGHTVLIAAHGNSLRALVKHLSGISDAEITGLEIPTGQPIVYELDDALNAVERYYLAER